MTDIKDAAKGLVEHYVLYRLQKLLAAGGPFEIHGGERSHALSLERIRKQYCPEWLRELRYLCPESAEYGVIWHLEPAKPGSLRPWEPTIQFSVSSALVAQQVNG